VTSALDEATTELTKLLVEAQEVLVGLRLSVKAEVPLDELKSVFLGFGKVDKDWRLYVRAPNQQVVPIESASRENRTLAARRLVDLRAKMLEEQERQLTEVDAATTTLEATLNAWRCPS
jgi:hypothetical protein